MITFLRSLIKTSSRKKEKKKIIIYLFKKNKLKRRIMEVKIIYPLKHSIISVINFI